MNTYTIGWITWLLLFVAIEGLALYDRDPGDTFTEHFRRWLKLATPAIGSSARTRASWWVTRIVVILFGTWLTLHMAFGWFGGGEGILG